MSPRTGKAAQLIDRSELLIDAIDDYAMFMLDLDGTVASWNRGAQRIKGYTAEEVIGLPFDIFYTAEDLAAGKPARELEAAAAFGQHRGEGWRVRKDSSVFWANVLITAVKNAEGHLIGYAKVTHDDTDRQKAEKLTRQLDLLNERERVSCELQETVVQQIHRAGLRLSAIANLTDDPEINERVLASIADLDDSLREIRGVITDHHVARVTSRGLPPAHLPAG